MLDRDDPDGHGPIDAVVTWCDGGDAAFQRRRLRRVQRLRREEPALAARSSLRFDPVRYVEHDEVRFCIRSILNRAPWIRRIWLVTDRQFPSCFDRRTLDPRVARVGHAAIFGEAADALPVFNSAAIAMMTWRIPGLADRFILFNDDVFLSRAASPQDFFDGDSPLLHGQWMKRDEKTPAWFERRIRSAELFGYDADHFFMDAHVCFSLSRPMIEEIDARLHETMLAEARKPFRTPDCLSIVGLHSHFGLREGRAHPGTRGQWMILDRYPSQLSEPEVRARLAPIADGRYLVTCFNNIGSFLTAMPDFYDYIAAGAGPRLPFELGEPPRAVVPV